MKMKQTLLRLGFLAFLAAALVVGLTVSTEPLDAASCPSLNCPSDLSAWTHVGHCTVKCGIDCGIGYQVWQKGSQTCKRYQGHH